MNVLIVEDEAPASRRLRRLVAAALAQRTDLIALVDTLESAQKHIESESVDLILLDLDLSGKDGFDLLRDMNRPRIPTIIVSANTDRALTAFDYDVVDFISKPVEEERLERALNRARKTNAGELRIVIKSQGQADIISASSIVSLSGADDYVEIVTDSGQNLLHYDRLDALEKTLPTSFLRIHRSHIVNLKHAYQITTMENGGRAVVVSGGTELPISRRKHQSVKAALEAIASHRNEKRAIRVR